MVQVRVPATTANLGPGFDTFGLALGLWNEARFSLAGKGIRVAIEGAGADELPKNQRNLIAGALMKAYHAVGQAYPQDLRIECVNNIPLRSGLGSSCAAALCGIIGANEMMGKPLEEEQVLALAVEMEGHADNAAAALLGGLVIVVEEDGRLITRRVEIAEWQAAVVLPQVKLRTKQARQALPKDVPHPDAVFNVGHSALVIEALRDGDLPLLREAMQDRLHEKYRYKLIPGSKMAIEAAREMGAAAALSGAGPSVVAFVKEGVEMAAEGMAAAFVTKGVRSTQFHLAVSESGAQVEG